MESELLNLQRRVAELEAALALISKERSRKVFRCRTVLAPLICVSVFALCVAILLVRGAGPAVNAQGGSKGPSKVVAPFEVVDGAGKTLLRVIEAEQGGGSLSVWGSGSPVAFIRSGSSGATGEIALFGGQDFRVRLGTAEGDQGLITVTSPKGRLSLSGLGVVEAFNAQGNEVVNLGPLDHGAGGLDIKTSAGQRAALVWASKAGNGSVQLYNSSGGERVTLGTLENGKGDVCASGDQGAVCLSLVRPKY